MSRFLSGLAKFSTQRSVLRTLTGPYLTLGARFKQQIPDGTSIGDNLVFDPTKEKTVTIPDLIVPKQLIGSSVVGISCRWGICSTDKEDGSSLLMRNYQGV